jgi:hypothetical protein
MRLGNSLASIGIVLVFIGFICLPLYNFHELPYTADPAYPKGSGWMVLMQTGIFARPGILLIATGGGLFFIAKLLPRRYWKTEDELLLDEIEKGAKKRLESENSARRQLLEEEDRNTQ